MTETDVRDPLQALGDARRAYVIPDLKIVYISLAKNACTTLKWLVAELAGEDPKQFFLGAGLFVTKDEGIHVRSRWQHTPTLGQVPAELRAQISPENGWFVFGVVRDPRIRLFSAWQNKMLMRSPAYTRWRDEPWYPRVPQTPEHVVEDFATFVDFMVSHPDAPLLRDAHFRAQVPYLNEDIVPYSSIYEIGTLNSLLGDLERHVRSQGWTRQLRLRRSNDTPLRARADLFPGPVREQLDAHFHEDLERFGHHWDLDRLESVPQWSTDTMATLQLEIAMSERIGGLIEMVMKARARTAQRDERVDHLRDQLKQVRAGNEELRRQIGDPTWKRAARPVVRHLRSRLNR